MELLAHIVLFLGSILLGLVVLSVCWCFVVDWFATYPPPPDKMSLTDGEQSPASAPRMHASLDSAPKPSTKAARLPVAS